MKGKIHKMDKIDKILDEYNIFEVNFKNASDEIVQEIYEQSLENWEESTPMLPKPRFEQIKQHYKRTFDTETTYKYIIRDKNDDLVATATLSFISPDSNTTQENKEKAYIGIQVRRQFRRKHIAREILKILTKKAEGSGVKKVNLYTMLEPGHKFCLYFDGKIVSRSFNSYFDLKKANWSGFEKMNTELAAKNPDIKIKTFYGLPEEDFREHFEIIARYYEEISKYSDEWDFDREFFLEEAIPEEKKDKARGEVKIFSYAYSKDNKIIGMSELIITPENPEKIYTHLTGVENEFRGRGLCQLLKTEVMLYVKNNLPGYSVITTGNDEDNKIMRSINEKLGFVSLPIHKGYSFNISKLKEKLEKNDCKNPG